MRRYPNFVAVDGAHAAPAVHSIASASVSVNAAGDGTEPRVAGFSTGATGLVLTIRGYDRGG
jgi:hypothetical protein